ncbi:tripartite tricarboxylate transporter TctB family protein [Paenibacillus sp. GCM10027626]|uniref:tripartite tricarboxylate transporter TctB family protein n=1 Tax=Paenibacillus sp. GCM10027626 TaxID=3273411 RepID=UPI003642CD38
MRAIRADRVIAIVLAAISVMVWTVSQSFNQAGQYEMGPAFFPRALGVILLLLAVLLWFNSKPPAADSGEKIAGSNYWLLAKSVGALVAYALLSNYLTGFIIATMLYLFVQMRILQVKNWIVLLSVSIGITIVLYFGFVRLLAVPLPEAIW